MKKLVAMLYVEKEIEVEDDTPAAREAAGEAAIKVLTDLGYENVQCDGVEEIGEATPAQEG